MSSDTNGDKTLDDAEEKYDALNDNDTYTLTATEKKFLLLAERGDCAGVRGLIVDLKDNPEELNINCVDPLNRSALIAAIENENIELIRLLLESGILVKVSGAGGVDVDNTHTHTRNKRLDILPTNYSN